MKVIDLLNKIANGDYVKNFLGVNETTTYFVEQLEPKSVSDKRYNLIIKPSTLIPTIETR